MTPAYAHLNLLRNPFGELTAEERAALAIADIAPWVDFLAVPRSALQFLGESGTGKTTRLLALQQVRPGSAVQRIVPQEAFHAQPDSPMLLDEFQLLPSSQRKRIYRTGLPLALATHVDYRRELESSGYRVQTVCPHEALTPDLVAAICERRIEAARRGPGPLPGVRGDTVTVLLQKFGADVRAIENELYGRFQSLLEVEHV
jgi:hypothetical protein